ncbi:hypothetical protein CEP54_012170 [Fusarium duplospermum]|uniref:Amine oxidase n=1 Tax=Fusarium duplospermum TaxID=1325734 RepID=A0A428PA57_9HYPO|nr:hypothetical protein CEP54_012170 [Fusarium duplospermum]
MSTSTEGFAWTPTRGYEFGLRTQAVVPSTPESDLSSEYDIIVIGAGYAGLAAARDLAFAGKKVLLVEARDRVGGRVFSAETDDGNILEIGGGWVHWLQPHVFSELTRYGLDDFVETKSMPEGCEVFSKQSREAIAMAQSPTEAEKFFGEMEALMSEVYNVDGGGGRTVLPFPFNTTNSMESNSEYGNIDDLSIKARVEQLTQLTDEQRHALMEHAASFFGIPPDRVSFTEVLRTFALCNFSSSMIEEATMKWKIAKGTTALALAILKDFKGNRIFASPVRSISQGEGAHPVTVTLESGKQLQSRFAISTIPWNVLPSIQFQPTLSPTLQDALANGTIAARTEKLLVATAAELPNGFNISCEGGDMPFASGFADGKHGKDTLLTLLTHPDIDLEKSDENLRLAETLHPNGLKVTSAWAHLWSKDRFAGGVMPIRQAGFLKKYYHEVRKPHGRVHFCGSDFADGWRGFMSGAFEDAYRVTKEVLNSDA